MDPYLASSYAPPRGTETYSTSRRGGDFPADAFLGSQVLRFVQAAAHGAPVGAETPFGAQEAGAQFTCAALEGTMRIGSQVGSALLQEGGKLLERTNLVKEGPKPLRALCFVGERTRRWREANAARRSRKKRSGGEKGERTETDELRDKGG
ncbi:hypothetical protein TGMAS_267300A [Toxoplasma gondii MAS]|uniref:Uncharacterized protein n=1 Tax=Toxoplasma gondii MAS TaxID=943118 RepID=A0A086QMD0_TOXGO|nr:hypothetical protein TGMAS_267300A [Toxoplasma gondii MAS]